MRTFKKIIKYKFLIIIIIIAALLRLWRLGDFPIHLTPDEASLGYNTYSILKTGKDMHGDFLPIIMKSFGDYTPALYVYLSIPFVAIFGLTEFSVRLVSALSGVVSVYLIYLVADGIFSKMKKRFSKTITLSAAFLAAVNPWLIHFSRGAWVPNLSLTLTLAGVYFFYRSLEKEKFFIFSSALFALTLLSYQGAKITSFLVVSILLIVFAKRWIRFDKKILVGSFFIAFLLSLPIVISIFQNKAGRLDVLSLFSYPRSETYVKEILNQGKEYPGSVSYYFFHSESLNFAKAALDRYFNHFSGRFLFFEGDWENPRHNAPFIGMFLLLDGLLMLFGFFAFVRNKKGVAAPVVFIFIWLFTAPFASAITRDQVHAVRSFHMVIPLLLISAVGLAYIYYYLIKKGIAEKIIFASFAFFYGLNYLYYLDSYYIHMSIHNAKNWDYGYEQIVGEVLSVKNNYEKIIIKQSYEQPFIYFLFYGVGKNGIFQPEQISKILKYNESRVGDVGLVEELDNIYFTQISWPIGGVNPGELVVIDGLTVTPQMIGEDYEIISEIKYPDENQTAFWILEKV